MYETDLKLLLSQIPGVGLHGVKNFLTENKFFLEDRTYINSVISKKYNIRINVLLDKVKKIKDSCNKLNITIINYTDNKIIDEPLLLYLKGDIDLYYNNKKLGIIGTRKPNPNSLIIAKEYIKYSLSKNWIITSGLAAGCDTFAHKAALKRGHSTIAVIPSGYKPGLSPWLLENGLIISEYPPYTPIKKFRCVNRNRIITGLSRGVFVIESSIGSGTEHSLRFSKKQNKPICYIKGYKGIEEFSKKHIRSVGEFDLFLKKCIE